MKKNLVLVAILAAIAVFYLWDTRRIKEKEEAEEEAKKVFVHDGGNIGQITLDKGTEVISAKKEGENWLLTSPLETQGDKTNWNSIANTLGNAKKQRTIESVTPELSAFGLDQPSLKVTIADLGGATPEQILIGKKTPTGSETYAMLTSASDTVFTVYNSVPTAADKSLFDLRDKTILAMETKDVQRVDVAVGPSSYQVSRSGDKDWRITQPFLARGDKTKTEGFINKIRNGRVKQFVDEKPQDLAQYGLVNPATRLVFWIGEPGTESQWSSKTLVLGATSAVSGQVYGKREGQDTVFAVETSILSDVPKSPDALRMRKVTDMRSWDVDRFAVARAGEVILEASKEGTKWMVLGPEKREADYTGVSDLLRAITDLEVYDFVTEATDQTALGIDKPQMKFSLITRSATEEIALSAPQERKALQVCYGARENPRELYALLIDDASEIFSKVAGVKIKEATPEEEDKV
jgi:hypothetical protein